MSFNLRTKKNYKDIKDDDLDFELKFSYLKKKGKHKRAKENTANK